VQLNATAAPINRDGMYCAAWACTDVGHKAAN